jgi:hypothetical protein
VRETGSTDICTHIGNVDHRHNSDEQTSPHRHERTLPTAPSPPALGAEQVAAELVGEVGRDLLAE